MPNGLSEYYLRESTDTQWVLVALGSNRGDSAAIVTEAIGRLRTFAVGDYRPSSLWLTAPVDCPPDAQDFVNAVVAFRPLSQLTPEQLLRALKSMERDFGRAEYYVRNAPRELDLDLLCFGEERRDSVEFTLPHPRAHLRRFVLAPAAEVAADLVWPGTGRTVAQLLDALPAGERVVRMS